MDARIDAMTRHSIVMSDDLWTDFEVKKCGNCGGAEHLDTYYALYPDGVHVERKPEDFLCAYCLVNDLHDEDWVIESPEDYDISTVE